MKWIMVLLLTSLLSACTNPFGKTSLVEGIIASTHPTILSLQGPVDGSYKENTTLNFYVTFSEPMEVLGSPRLLLNIGGVIKYATYVSGSGNAQLHFRYTVEAGLTDSNGISLGSLQLNGGHITDASLNAADLSFAAPDLAQVLVDTTSPQITSSSTPGNITYTNNQDIQFTVYFDEDVLVTGTPRIPLTVGSQVRNADYLSGSGTSTLYFKYTVQNNDLDKDDIEMIGNLDFNGGSVTDVAGNETLTPFTPANTAGVHIIPCPANYILVNAQPGNGTAEFCVAKYEMKNVGGNATSAAPGLPWTGLNRADAVTACSNLGSGFNLITNRQWQAIAKDIESMNSNWRYGVIGVTDGISRGHSDGVPAGPLAADPDDNESCSGTGQTCSLGTWDSQRRTHELSSGFILWDFSGNVAEWILETNATNFGADTSISMLTSGNHPAVGLLGGVTGTAVDHFGAADSYVTHTTSPFAGLGYGLLNSAAGGITRGCSHSCGTNAGVFAVDLTLPETTTSADLGFRCTWNP